MKLIKKLKTRDALFSVIRSLSREESEAIFWVFVNNQGTPTQRKLAIIIAEFMKDHDAWVWCDCDETTRPLMTVGLSVKGKYYLKRIPLRGKHDKACVFKEVGHSPSFTESHEKASLPLSQKKPLLLHRRGHIQEGRAKKTTEHHGKPSNERLPQLARVLYTWLTKAHLNQLSLNTAMNSQIIATRLKAVASAYALAHHIKADDFLFTHPDVACIVHHLKTRANQWPKQSRPYALCIAVATQIDGKTVYFQDKEKTITVTLNGEMKASSGRIGANSHPFLVIFTVTDTANQQGHYQPMNGFYVPVYDKNQWIPVDSRYERLVLNRLEKYAHWWKGKHIQTRVTKPLFDIEAMCEGKRVASKPDFLIETPDQTYILEVMGSHEPEYLERKQRTVSWMKALGTVIEFDALHAEKTNAWDVQLEKHFNRLSALIFKEKRSEENC